MLIQINATIIQLFLIMPLKIYKINTVPLPSYFSSIFLLRLLPHLLVEPTGQINLLSPSTPFLREAN